jgi:hypothetical protein
MAVQLEDIIAGLSQGSLSLDEACRAVATAAKADPVRTRFWNQRIETEAAKGRLTRSAARALFDALEGFQADRTVWFDSTAIASLRSATPKPSDRRATPAITSLEQLREILFRPLTRPVALARAALRRDEEPQTVQLELAPSTEPEPTPTLADTLPIGTVLDGRYQLVAPLGPGGIGQVFDAIDLEAPPDDNPRVAVKVIAISLREQPSAYDALAAVVQRTHSLVHPNIVGLRGIGKHEDRVFIVMEPLRGRWLSTLVREVRGNGLAFEQAWPIVRGIAAGLAYAHRHGVVHCDLNPHAVFLCEDGTPKIVGFGLVRAVPASNESLDVLDTLTMRAYSEAYTADPWAQQATPHPADDLYPLGVIAYELLAGKHPFQRCTLAVARQRGLKYEPLPWLNRRARKLIDRCLSFERQARPQDGATALKRMQPGLLRRLLFAGS